MNHLGHLIYMLTPRLPVSYLHTYTSASSVTDRKGQLHTCMCYRHLQKCQNPCHFLIYLHAMLARPGVLFLRTGEVMCLEATIMDTVVCPELDPDSAGVRLDRLRNVPATETTQYLPLSVLFSDLERKGKHLHIKYLHITVVPLLVATLNRGHPLK